MSQATEKPPLIELRKVSRRFVKSLDFAAKLAAKLGADVKEETVHAVDGVDLAVREGEVVGLVGESGCGKSTLGRVVAGILPESSGEVFYRGRKLGDLKGKERIKAALAVQMIFQDPFASLNPRMRVRDIVAEPMRAAGIDAATRDARVREMLSIVGLPADAAERYPHAFSGGQRQRIAIARALASSPKLVVCDEATSALDVSVQAQVLNLLGELRARYGLSMLFISHNLGAVRYIADRVAIMYLGRIVEIGPVGEIFDKPAHPYTEALIAAVPEPDPDLPIPEALLGEIPNARERPSGCHFHPRCPKAQDRCRVEDPALVAGADGRQIRCHFPN
jgi:peptide/nickel transport system ATP-binding protein